MKTTVKKADSKAALSPDSAKDEKVRKLVSKAFPECSWFGGLPTVRELFTAIFDDYGDRLAGSTKPELDEFQIRREHMFLQNLSGAVAVSGGRAKSLNDLYMESCAVIGRTTPPIEGLAAKNLAIFRTRIAQYMYRIRTARNTTE